MTTHRIVSIETARGQKPNHEVVTAVHTSGGESDAADHRWTVAAVLKAMDRADRFYTVAPNGRNARIQRYNCGICRAEHIRTHLSDGAIHELRILPQFMAEAIAEPVS